jgi:peptidyl-prolyl cis-trans isomerase SurA
MKNFIFIFKVLFIFFFFQISTLNSAIENKIVASVDEKIISSYELENKIKTMLFMSKQELNQKNVNDTKSVAMSSLINLKLKEKELEKFNISLKNNKAVKIHLQDVSNRLNLSLEDFKEIFKINNLDYDLYLEEIKIEFAWQGYIYQKYSSKMNINKSSIEEELNIFLKNKKNIEKYNLAEIEILLTNEKEAIKRIDEIKDQINLIGFENTAIKFSNSSSALDGGNLGWISSKSFSSKISKLIKDMNVGDVSSPIYQTNSVVFLKLLDKKVEKLNDINIDEVKNQIFEKKANEMLTMYSNNYISKIKNSVFIEYK